MAAQDNTSKTDKTIYPIYVIFGRDHRRSIDKLQEIIDTVLDGADPQTALNIYEGSEVAASDIFDELRTLPFLSPRRVVVIKQADSFISKYRPQMEKYLETPSATGVLVLQTESFPKNTRLARLVGKIGQALAFEPFKPRELVNYLIQYTAQTSRLTLTQPAAALLVELAGDDSDLSLSEVDKIISYLADAPADQRKITPTVIESVVANNRQYNIFNIIDAMLAGDTAAALSWLDRMLEQDRNAQFTAVGAFAWNFRRLYNARLLWQQRIADRQIIQQLRIWSKPEEFMQQVKRITIPQIATVLQELLHIDIESKTGGSSVKIGLEKLIINFSHLHHHAA